MPSQMLIYESAAPLTATRHGDWSLELANDFSFSKNVNSVPLMAIEFPNAASEYAIVFSGTKDAVIPVAILGMRADENLYLTEAGTWEAKYIPAFIRRYPFVFAISEDGSKFALCIDESFPKFNQEGKGERLFTDDRKPTPYVERALKFLEHCQTEFRRTQAFCRKLVELDLLEPMQAQAQLSGGKKLSLGGFMAVNREKVRALPADKLAELAQTNELELLYLHLNSMRNFSNMAARLNGQVNVPPEMVKADDDKDEVPSTKKKRAARATK